MRWLLRWLVDDDDRRVIEDELAELYEFRRRRDGDRAAARWLRRQQFVYPLHLINDRLRGALPARGTLMSHLWRDLVYSVRTLARAPIVAATIVLTVGIGLGATTAMTSVIRAVLVNPLPYADANNLYWIYTDAAPYRFRFSVVDYRALEADHSAFGAIAGYQSSQVTIADGGVTERVTAKDVTGSYFSLLGQKPVAGRLIGLDDEARGDRVAVLTYAYWMRHFGGQPVVGRTLTVNGQSTSIIGVLEQTGGPLERDLALFTAQHWPTPKRKGPFFTMVLARLNTGVSQTAAKEALRATNKRLFPIWQSSYQDAKATWNLLDLKSRVVGNAGSTLFVVLAAVGCVLLIACANAVNLLVARAVGRSRELAIRGALGASRARLLQTLLAEAAVLTIGAVIVGFVVAAGGIKLITTYGGAYVPRLDEVRMSGPVIEWLALLSVVSGVIIGLVPAIHSSRLKMDRALGSSGRSASDAPAARRLRRVLVAAEFALATPLIVSAALVLTSLDRLSHVPVGIDTSRLLTASVQLTGASYGNEDGRSEFWKRAIVRLAALPGVEAAAIADSRPPDETGQINNFDLEDHPATAGQNQPTSPWVGVSPEFFNTVGLKLERGRLLDTHSLQNDEVVVDRAWANRFFPGENAVGRRMHEGGCSTCPWTTVIGVVDNVKWVGLDTTSEQGTVYFPLVDVPNAFFVLRTSGDPAMLALGLQQAVRELDPGLALSEIATGDDLVASSLAEPRYLTVLIGMFAAAALVLSLVGVYGVMAYFVQQHTRDIGVRLALGGDPAAMRRLVLLQGLRIVAIGVVIGVGAAFLTARLVKAILFDVSPTDPQAMIAVPLMLLIVATLACLVPARRAARLDPATILRES